MHISRLHSSSCNIAFALQDFDLHARTEWDEDMVVAMYRKNPIKAGGTAKLWQIDMPEEFVGQTLRDISSGCRFNAGSEQVQRRAQIGRVALLRISSNSVRALFFYNPSSWLSNVLYK